MGGPIKRGGPLKKGIYSKFSGKLGSNPFDLKIELNGPKTSRKGVGKGSRGIGQPVASSSSNMSPWGLMANPFKPIFINFRTFSAIKVSGRLWESSGEVFRVVWGSLEVSLGGLWEAPLWRGVSRGPGVTREEKCVKTIAFFSEFSCATDHFV